MGVKDQFRTTKGNQNIRKISGTSWKRLIQKMLKHTIDNGSLEIMKKTEHCWGVKCKV